MDSATRYDSAVPAESVRGDVVPLRRSPVHSRQDLEERPKVVAARFRALLKVMVGRALEEMGANAFGMMIRPFLPMIYPVIDGMNDAAALGILAFVKERITYVETGVES
jgi:hypothetical protein